MAERYIAASADEIMATWNPQIYQAEYTTDGVFTGFRQLSVAEIVVLPQRLLDYAETIRTEAQTIIDRKANAAGAEA